MTGLEFTCLLAAVFFAVCACFSAEDVSAHRRIRAWKRERLVVPTRNHRRSP